MSSYLKAICFDETASETNSTRENIEALRPLALRLREVSLKLNVCSITGKIRPYSKVHN